MSDPCDLIKVLDKQKKGYQNDDTKV